MKKMIERCDLAELAPERIYIEIEKALVSQSPGNFFRVLDRLGAAEKLWPELEQSALLLLDEVTRISPYKEERLAALLWKLDSAKIKVMQSKLKLPNHLVEIALQRGFYEPWENLENLNADSIVKALYDVDAFRRSERFYKLNSFFSTISKLLGKRSTTHEYKAKWLQLHEAASSIRAQSLLPDYSGAELGKALRAAQIIKVSTII